MRLSLTKVRLQSRQGRTEPLDCRSVVHTFRPASRLASCAALAEIPRIVRGFGVTGIKRDFDPVAELRAPGRIAPPGRVPIAAIKVVFEALGHGPCLAQWRKVDREQDASLIDR